MFEYAYTPACMNTGPPDEDGVFRGNASCSSSMDSAVCPQAEFAMWGYSRLVADSNGPVPNPAWQRMPGVHCFGPDETWSVADLTAMAEARVREYLAENALRPEVRAEPAGGSLVNLPVVVHTPPAGDVGFDVTEPLPGRLEATPSYGWDFGEPAAAGEVHEGPGTPYTAGVSPVTNPAFYVSHAYGDPGERRITLEMTWQATFTVVGIVVPLDEIVFTDSADITVHTAASQLVATGPQ